MQFFTALVEHLVVGVVGIAWALPLLQQFGISVAALDADSKTIGIAAICYVLGIYVDIIASPLVSELRKQLLAFKIWLNIDSRPEKQAQVLEALRQWVSFSPTSSYERTAKIVFESPEDRVRHCEVLVSRERIARGMVVNAIAFAFVSLCVPSISQFVLSILLFLLSFVAWLRLKALSHRFKDRVVSHLDRSKLSVSPNTSPDKSPGS